VSEFILVEGLNTSTFRTDRVELLMATAIATKPGYLKVNVYLMNRAEPLNIEMSEESFLVLRNAVERTVK
jgi:hypothetical protein